MDKCRRKDMIRNKEIKDWGDPCWWKDEGESLEMDRSCLEESNYCTNEKEWVVQVEGIKKGKRKTKNNINSSSKKWYVNAWSTKKYDFE